MRQLGVTSAVQGGGKRRDIIAFCYSQMSAARPIPICRCAIVAGDAALDHLVAPLVARHDEGGQISCWPLLSWTMKQAGHSSTNQGAGKRRFVTNTTAGRTEK